MEHSLGPYRVQRLVRSGGQGSVYLGYDSRLARPVAIKVYDIPLERARRERLLREARLVAAIQSPRVVQVYDVISSRDHLAMVMEYVPGIDLETVLAHTRLTLPAVLAVATDTAAALAAARQQQLVHGDLKASNLLVTETGHIKLTDFGIALPVGGLAPGVGSPGCLSPEQYRGEPLDVRSDLFALGCLLYRLLTDVRAFVRSGKLDVDALLHHEPAPLEHLYAGVEPLPGPLSALVRQLLRKDPADRPPNTHQVRQVLRDISRTLPAAPANALLQESRPWFRPAWRENLPPSLPGRLTREGRSELGLARWRRNRRVALVAAVLAGVLLLGGGALWWSRPIRVELAIGEWPAGQPGTLPPGLTPRWLARELREVLRETVARVEVSGPPGLDRQPVLYRPGTEPRHHAAQEVLQLQLQCRADLCLVDLVRRRSGEQRHGQALVPADSSRARWGDSLRQVVASLYRRGSTPLLKLPDTLE